MSNVKEIYVPEEQMEILVKASKVCLDRGKQYGDPCIKYDKISKIWSQILGEKVTPQQVVLMMMAIKIVRLSNDPGHEDSLVDVAGYAQVYGML